MDDPPPTTTISPTLLQSPSTETAACLALAEHSKNSYRVIRLSSDEVPSSEASAIAEALCLAKAIVQCIRVPRTAQHSSVPVICHLQ